MYDNAYQKQTPILPVLTNSKLIFKRRRTRFMNTFIYLPSTEMLIYVVTESSDSFHLVVHRDLLSGFRNVFCNDFPFRYCTSHLFANQILAIHNLFKQLEWISRPWSEDPLWLWPRLVLEMISKFGWTTRKYIVSKPSAEITDVRTVVRKLRALTVRLWWWIGYGVPGRGCGIYDRSYTKLRGGYRNVERCIFLPTVSHVNCNKWRKKRIQHLTCFLK